MEFPHIVNRVPPMETSEITVVTTDRQGVKTRNAFSENHLDSENPNEYLSNTDPISDKLQTMISNNSWNDKNERLIVSIGENAAAYKWMHEKNATRVKTFHKVMNIVMVVFNTGLSAQTLIPQGDTRNEAITIVSQVFIYIVTLVSVLANFLKLEELAAKHTTYAMKFSELYHDIQQQMCMYRKDRYPATNYIQETLRKLDDIVLSAPTIDSAVISQFKTAFKDSSIAQPSIADKIQTIDILSDYPPTQSVQAQSKSSKSFLPVSKNNKKSTQLKLLNEMSHTQNSHLFHIPGDFTDNEMNTIELSERRT